VVFIERDLPKMPSWQAGGSPAQQLNKPNKLSWFFCLERSHADSGTGWAVIILFF
jgi:hypothetical protein